MLYPPESFGHLPLEWNILIVSNLDMPCVASNTDAFQCGIHNKMMTSQTYDKYTLVSHPEKPR